MHASSGARPQKVWSLERALPFRQAIDIEIGTAPTNIDREHKADMCFLALSRALHNVEDRCAHKTTQFVRQAPFPRDASTAH